MLSKQPRLVVTFVLLVVGVMGADQEGQGRQMNWNGIKSMSNKPAAFGNSNYLADVDAGSSMTAQAKSSANYQGLSSQSLDGTGDLNRDGPYSSGGGDYAYEPNYASDLSSGYHGEDKLGTFVTALTAFLPIGLFLAAIVPNIITVSSGRRKRSDKEEVQIAQDEATFPILDMISSFGVRSLQEPSCQSKIVCEIGRMGGLPEANTVQRALWLAANYVPQRFSRLLGMEKLFRQIRSQQCSEFKCASD